MKNLQSIILDHIVGQDSSTAPELIREGYVKSILNMVIDSSASKFKLKRRGGFGILNNNTISTTPTKVLYDVLTDSSANYLIAGNGSVLAKSLNGSGSWVNIKTGLTNPKVNVQPYSGKFYATNGDDALFVFGGNTLTDLWNLGIEQPDSSVITSAHISADIGSMGVGRYKYVMVYVTESGERSAPSMPFTHRVGSTSPDSTTTKRTLKFSNLPIPTDTRITQKLIYRTEANGEVFYRLYPYTSHGIGATTTEMLSASDTFFVDNTPDNGLITSDYIEYIRPPLKAEAITFHKERMFLGNVRMNDLGVVPPAHTKTAISAPTDFTNGYSLTLSATSGGSMDEANTYAYKFCFYDSNGNISETINKSVALGAGDSAVLIEHIPVMATRFASGVDKLRIYRTAPVGEGTGIYFLHSEYNPTYGITQVSITDTMDDQTLIEKASYPTTEKDYKSTILFSEIGKPNELIMTNSVDVYPDDGDEITSLYDDENGILIFKRHSIYKIYTNGSPENWIAEKLFTNLGAEHFTHILQSGKEYVFYYQGKMYLMQGMSVKVISEPIRSSFDGLYQFNSIGYIPSKQWYVMSVCPSAYTTYMQVYDIKLDCWYTFQMGEDKWGSEGNGTNSANAIALKKFGTYSGSLIFADPSRVKIYGSGTVDLDSTGVELQIPCRIETKKYVLGDNFSKSIIREIVVSATGTTLSCSIYGDTTTTKSFTDGTNIPLNILDDKVYILISGVTIESFNSFRLSFRPVRRGSAVK